jgi:hypothetical protein
MRRGLGHSPGRRQLIQGLSWAAIAATGRLRRAFSGIGPSRPSATRLRFFTAREAEQLDTWGNALVPGARSSGLSRYIDRYVSVAPAECLLTLRYLDVAPPYGEFYRQSLQRLGPYHDIDEALPRMAEREPLFYFALRSDALDVTYGTMSGFGTLGVPCLPHIAPRVPW